MALDLNDIPIIIRVPASASIPPGTIPAAEWTEYKNRVIDQENKALNDLTDVDTSGAENGQSLVKTAAGWRPGEAAKQLEMQQGDVPSSKFGPVEIIDGRLGLAVAPDPTYPQVGVMRPIYGTQANTIAEGNHTHAIRVDVPLRFAASGSLSGSTRTLVSGNITGLDPARTYIVKAHLSSDVRGEGTGAGTTLPRITIAGNARDRFGVVRTVAGVDRSYDMRHPGVSVSDVSNVAVSATLAYQAGDPINVGAGELVVIITSNR